MPAAAWHRLVSSTWLTTARIEGRQSRTASRQGAVCDTPPARCCWAFRQSVGLRRGLVVKRRARRTPALVASSSSIGSLRSPARSARELCPRTPQSTAAHPEERSGPCHNLSAPNSAAQTSCLQRRTTAKNCLSGLTGRSGTAYSWAGRCTMRTTPSPYSGNCCPDGSAVREARASACREPGAVTPGPTEQLRATASVPNRAGRLAVRRR